MTVHSPVTGAPSRFLFEKKVLGRHNAKFYLDETIDYIFAHDPHWLDEAYSSAIASTDTGIVQRNNNNVRRVSRLISKGPVDFARGVDIGGGYGLFVRGMRDIGYNFYWQDKYAENLVARGFEAKSGNYEVAVAFEVLEHLANPSEFLSEMHDEFQFDTCFFSATCFENGRVPPVDWWYWAFETGQHISFFSISALRAIGRQLNMELFAFGGDLFAFSTLDWSGLKARSSLLDHLLVLLKPPYSLTQEDHVMMRDKLRESH